MGTANLSDFLRVLDRSGELARIGARVSPVLEIAEIADRVSKSPARHQSNERDKSPAAVLGGKALLFENVEGSDIPVAINTFGSYWRINQALGTTSLDALAERVQQPVQSGIPATSIEQMKRLPDLLQMACFPPKVVKSGICQEVVHEGDKAD
jgi:4-hydroxy-3-polyprenylbenzoate decarboxylase